MATSGNSRRAPIVDVSVLIAKLGELVDPELIHRAATQGLSDREQLSQEVSGWLAGR
jgi:hypothetical protein